MAQRPAAIGLMLCEQVILEDATHNVTPVNCFSRRYVDRIPSEPITMVLLAYLTDGSGEVQLEVVLERLDTLDEIFRRPFPVRFANPLQEVRWSLRLRNFSFPVEGFYRILLYADKEIIAQKKFQITRKEQVS